MDNPEKYQYDNTEIQVFGGFDLESCLALSTGDKRQALKEMLLLVVLRLISKIYLCMNSKKCS